MSRLPEVEMKIARLASLGCVLMLGGGLLAGCGASSSDSASSESAAGAPAADRAADGGAAPVADAKQAAAGTAGSAATAVTKLVRTAQVSLEVGNVAAAATAVRTIAVALGGLVSTERQVETESELTLRVPEPQMDAALTRIAKAGRELERSTTSEDVTATVADLDSRVATQTRSVGRVRDLLERAKSLQDVVLLESELARRESDLEAVQARQRALSDQAALATITVTLRTPAAAEEPDQAGFLAGLDNGWTALMVSTIVVLTVIGALLPIGVVLALIGAPVYLLYRRRRAHPALPAPATPAP
jgi:hypothetical protein